MSIEALLWHFAPMKQNTYGHGSRKMIGVLSVFVIVGMFVHVRTCTCLYIDLTEIPISWRQTTPGYVYKCVCFVFA